MKEERRRIFNLVKEGHLTVDEAMILLDNLDKKEAGGNESSSTEAFEESKKDEFNQNFKNIKDKVFGFVDSAVKKVKEVDFDFNFGNAVEAKHTATITEHISELELDVANGSITVEPWDKEVVEMNFTVKVFRAESEDQALKKFLHELNYKVVGSLLRLTIEPKTMKVETVIYVPRAKYEALKLRSFNGNIVASNLDAKECRVKTANGHIEMKEIISNNVELETANGNIELVDSTVNEVELESLNGKLTMVGQFEEVEAQSFNGDITLKLAGNKAKELHLNCVTGGIHVSLLEDYSVKGKCKTNLGNISVNLDQLEIIEEKREIVSKYVRFNTLTNAPELKLVADTKTGTVVIDKVKLTVTEEVSTEV
jgi:DUF4097 and DUF4098 domain-containing protein YvlB